MKVPFLNAHRFRQSHFVKIAEATYVNPENDKDQLKIVICAPSVAFNEERLTERYGHLNKDKVNFVRDLKSFVTAHNQEALKRKCQENGGKLKFRLNDQEVELALNEDFFLSACELENHKQ